MSNQEFQSAVLQAFAQQNVHIDGLFQMVAQVQSDTTKVQMDVVQIQMNIVKVQTEISGLKSDVTIMKSDISSMQSEIGDLKSDIGSLKSDTSNLRSDITKMQSNIAALETNLSNFRRETKRGFADQATMSNDIITYITDLAMSNKLKQPKIKQSRHTLRTS